MPRGQWGLQKIAPLVCCLHMLMPTALWAIAWEFETGETRGWSAVEGVVGGAVAGALSPLQSSVEDGAWRIELEAFDPSSEVLPSVLLVSPRIGHESRLFDRVSLRVRVVSGRPPEGGGVLLSWTNTENETTPGRDPGDCGDPLCRRFSVWRSGVNLGREWQEVTFNDLRTGEITESNGDRHPITWEGDLIDLRLEVLLGDEASLASWPEVLEIDRIVLTGFEEIAAGELLPPSADPTPLSGELFGEPSFSPIQVGRSGATRRYRTGLVHSTSGALGDLDGDGDLDLVLPWNGGMVWLLNSGDGRFGHSQFESTWAAAAPYLNGGDINGDGLMDLLQVRWQNNFTTLVRVKEGREGSGWRTNLEFRRKALGWADAEGDGDLDLWLSVRPDDFSSEGYSLLIYLNDGEGSFSDSLWVRNPIPEGRYAHNRWVHGAGPRRQTGVHWVPFLDEPNLGYRMLWIDEDHGVTVEDLSGTGLGSAESDLIQYVGDMNADDLVDLLVSGRTLQPITGTVHEGLTFFWNQGDGSFDRTPWLPDVHLSTRTQTEPVQVLDLNGDGRLDFAMVDANERDRALVVALGQGEGTPLLEGRYPFEGRGGILLGGDVDGDGDVDLVMDRSDSGNEGVYTWLNQLDPATAVTDGSETRGATPDRPALGANYPNPFNSQTWIPVDVPEGKAPAELRVFNLLGQPVRTLMRGVDKAGRHLVPWDGKDEEGRSVPAGVYLYQLRVGSDAVTRKMVNVE